MEELTTLEDCEFLTGNLFKNSFCILSRKIKHGKIVILILPRRYSNETLVKKIGAKFSKKKFHTNTVIFYVTF